MALAWAKKTAALATSSGVEDFPNGVIWCAFVNPSFVWSPEGKEIPGAKPITLRW